MDSRMPSSVIAPRRPLLARLAARSAGGILLAIQTAVAMANATHELSHGLGLEYLHGHARNPDHAGEVIASRPFPEQAPRSHNPFRDPHEQSDHDDHSDEPADPFHTHAFQVPASGLLEQPPPSVAVAAWMGPLPVAIVPEVFHLAWVAGIVETQPAASLPVLPCVIRDVSRVRGPPLDPTPHASLVIHHRLPLAQQSLLSCA
jgi:hypothetical protein